MVQVKVNEVTAVLGPLKERAEILDDHGMLIGHYEPVESSEDALYRKAASLFDPEEIRRRKQSAGPWLTTAEVFERLRSPGDD